MIRRRLVPDPGKPEPAPASDDLHELVLSLPWVVEHAYSVGTPGVRSFAVECSPLERRQLWLITGLAWRARAAPVAVVLPIAPARTIEATGGGRRIVSLPGRQVLMAVTFDPYAEPSAVELVVLTAYSYALSQRGLAVDRSSAMVIGAGPGRRERGRAQW